MSKKFQAGWYEANEPVTVVTSLNFKSKKNKDGTVDKTWGLWATDKQSFIKLTDIILPGVILAQGIGRWGNFFNQEAYGSLVSKELLEKLFIPKFVIEGMHINGNYYLPTFYIESILCILGFIIMLIIRKYSNKKGYITSFYLTIIHYSIR